MEQVTTLAQSGRPAPDRIIAYLRHAVLHLNYTSTNVASLRDAQIHELDHDKW
jgi:hypothetical protein